MFDDLNQVDWRMLGSEQAPQWIRGLASEDPSVRNESLDALLDNYVTENPDFARFVVPYILRILEHQEVNPETEFLLELLKHLRGNAKAFINQHLAIESSTVIINDIDNSKDLFVRLSQNPLVRETALHLISRIENT